MGNISNESMDALFAGLTAEEPQEEPQANNSTATRKNTKPKEQHEKKESFLVRFNQQVLGKARMISGAHKIPISDIIDFALEDYIKRYEKKYGAIELSDHKSAAELLK